MNIEEQNYWTKRYEDSQTGWDIGYPSIPIKTYIEQLKDTSIKILIPGAGNAYEAEHIFNQGFKNVYILDISEVPLKAFKLRNLDFPKSQILHGDFFKLKGNFDLIIEQTFFCSFVPTDTNRNAYAKKMYNLLKPNGKLIGLWFNIPLTGEMEKRPFGGNMKSYKNHLEPYFILKTFEKCYNSISERVDKELFGIFKKKSNI